MNPKIDVVVMRLRAHVLMHYLPRADANVVQQALATRSMETVYTSLRPKLNPAPRGWRALFRWMWRR